MCDAAICKCATCLNTEATNAERTEAIRGIVARNASAFSTKFAATEVTPSSLALERSAIAFVAL